MAKKYKRSVSAGSAARSDAQTAAATDTQSSAFTRRGATAEFNPDYGYVIKDLKRIGTLAGSFFVLLVVLSFFLNR